MQLKMTEVQAIMVLRELGIDPNDFATVRLARTLKEATRKLAALKASAKRGFKEAALRLHPDHNPGDSEKEELFRLVTTAHKEIQDLKVQAPPSPARRRTRVRAWPSTTIRTTTTTTTIDGAGVRVRVTVRK
jgi:hypothetical protein